jgi:hypothetical protein
MIKILFLSIISTIIILIILGTFKLLPPISLFIKRIIGLGHLESVDGEVLVYTSNYIIPIIFLLNLFTLYLFRNKWRL